MFVVPPLRYKTLSACKPSSLASMVNVPPSMVKSPLGVSPFSNVPSLLAWMASSYVLMSIEPDLMMISFSALMPFAELSALSVLP